MTTYSKKFITTMFFDNPIVRDHRVHDMRVLPGVTFLDMIYRYVADDFSGKEIVLRNILFKEPIVVTEEFDKKIFVSVEKINSFWKIIIQSQKVKNNIPLESFFSENAECEMHIENKPDHDTLDISYLKSSASFLIDMDDIYAYARKVNIVHHDFMKTRGKIYQSQDYILMELKLGSMAEKYSNRFYIHPALLDGSTFSLLPLVQNAMGDQWEVKPYIPIFIQEFRAPLKNPSSCYIYARKEIEIKGRDIVKDDLQAYDQEGHLIFLMNGLTAKQIRSKELITSLGKPHATEASSETKFHAIKESSTIKPTPQPITEDDGTRLIEDELLKMVANFLQKSVTEIDQKVGFYDLGLDSTHLLQMVRELETRLNCQLYPTLLFEYNTIQLLAEYLAKEHKTLDVIQTRIVPQTTTKTIADLYYYRPIWEQKIKNTITEDGSVLIIDTKNELVNLLKNKFQEITWIKPDKTFQKQNDHQYNINTSQVKDYTSLLNDLKQLPKYIVYCTTIDPPYQHFYTLLYLSQALIQQKPKEKIEILCVNEKSSPFTTALTGFANTLALENPKINCRIIDIHKLSDLLLEFAGEDREVRYDKQATRWVKEYQEIQISKDSNSIIRHQGVYLITGGAGGLGLIFARYLAEQYQAKLILMGRSILTEQQKSNFVELERSGAEIIYLRGNVTSKEDLHQVLKKAKDHFGTLNGVIHSAGVVNDALILNKSSETSKTVLAPKLKGVINLDEATQSLPLDFFVMFSSISAVLGNVGQSDYAYANAFMDAFSQERENLRKQGQRSGKSISINWPLWAEGGMKIDEASQASMERTLGAVPLATDNGTIAFMNVLAQEFPQQILLTGQKNKIELALKKYPKQQIRVEPTASYEPRDIAIIGISGRYPHAKDLDIFWENLKEGKDCITEIPQDRWDYKQYFDPDRNKIDKSYSKWGGFIDDVDKFDSLFFNISPREATILDPQERLFLETTWKTLEDAGYTYEILANKRVGVFVGVMYEQYQLYSTKEYMKEHILALESFSSSVANRVSYFFNFRGPSIALDTMCSSSLTSIYLACENIRNNKCDLAIAGGVNVSIHPIKYLFLSQSKMLSSDGRCRSFGEGGDGYVPSEGVGAILLKPLSQAISDGDHIYGVIKGSSINHGGRTGGYTIPNPVAQAELIEEALKDAQIPASTISYIEAHGTGTELGDPIEIAGLAKVFKKKEIPYLIGSVKSNIGHCESAAGMAAITKVLLQLQHAQLVPSIHSETLNPKIDWANTPFKVQHELSKWERRTIEEDGVIKEIPRRAGISSFGAGGSNAHIIIEEASETFHPPLANKSAYLITLSAKTENALRQRIIDLEAWLVKQIKDNTLPALENISYTLNLGRSHFDKRCALVVSTLLELKETLNELKQNKKVEQVCFGDIKKQEIKNEPIFKEVFKILMQELTKAGQFSSNEYRDKLRALANFYTQGYDLDWKVLHQGESHQKIALPTYPFAKEQYWFESYKAKKLELESSTNPTNTPLEDHSKVQPKVPVSDLPKPPTDMIAKMQNMLSEILLIDVSQIPLDQNFLEIGLNSISGVEFIREINNTFQINLSAVKIYDHPTLEKLSHYISTEIFSAIEKLPEESETNIQTDVGNIYKQKLNKKVVLEDINTNDVSIKSHNLKLVLENINETNEDIQTLTKEDLSVQTKKLRKENADESKNIHESLHTSFRKISLPFEEDKNNALNDIGLVRQMKADENNVLLEQNKNYLKEVRTILSTILFCNDNEISPSSNFQKLGLDSIAEIEFIKKINQLFKLDLEIVDLYNFKSIEELVLYIANSTSNNSNTRIQGIMPVNKEGDYPPIFSSTGGNAALDWMIKFSVGLGKEFPIYGFEPKGLQDNEKPFTSIQDIAKYYITAMRKIQPKGPYILAGYSVGGSIIHEMAHQLEKDHESVSLFILLDCYAVGSKIWQAFHESSFTDESQKFMLVGNVLGEAWGLTKPISNKKYESIEPQHRLNFVTEHLLKYSKPPFTHDDLSIFIKKQVDFLLAMRTAIKEYKPKIYNQKTRIFLFEGKKGILNTSRNSIIMSNISEEEKYSLQNFNDANGWRELFKSPITRFPIECDHFQICNEPYIIQIAKILKKIFKDSELKKK